MAAADTAIDWPWLVLTVLGVFCVEVAKNASGELVDYDSGTDQAVAAADRSPFSGGKRVLVDRLLTRGETKAIAALFYGAAALVGIGIVLFRDERVLSIGLIGMALAWYYHGGSIRLSYRGLGELAVALCGLVALVGACQIPHGDVDRVVEAARAVAIPADREIIHVLPQEFTVDDQTGITDPMGWPGPSFSIRRDHRSN